MLRQVVQEARDIATGVREYLHVLREDHATRIGFELVALGATLEGTGYITHKLSYALGGRATMGLGIALAVWSTDSAIDSLERYRELRDEVRSGMPLDSRLATSAAPEDRVAYRALAREMPLPPQ